MGTLPPLRALQVFEAVGRYSSVTEAAGWLGISPAAVSQQIKQLETHLKVRLVERDGRRLRMTQAGKDYHAPCAAAFEELRIATARTTQTRNCCRLGVSALPSLMAQWLTPQLGHWHQQRPEVALYLDGSHAEPDWEAGNIDFRITYSDRASEATNRLELFHDIVLPACHPSLVAEIEKDRMLAHIATLPLLSIDWQPKFSSPPSWRDWFFATSQEFPGNIHGHRVYSLSSLAIAAATAREGVVLAQYSMIQNEIASGQLTIPVLTPLWMPSTYYLTWRTSAFDSEHGRGFQRWLLQKGREQTQAIEALM
ncbi:LysR family transcriptional regulator [Halomonas sp. MC140]|nr:LysR family transcriptional regulator [Halomonas sp. MC140]MDN7131185.1 LysR family transcriptional regulator [Halomonas sp. MC140]